MHAAQNYIYIIFTVLYIVYSIVKAGKKVTKNRPTINQQPQSSPTVQPPTEKSPPQQDFKKILEELLGGTREEKNPTSPPTPLPQERGVVNPKAHPVAVKPEPTKIAPQAVKKEKIIPSHLHAIDLKKEVKHQKETVKKVVAEPVAVEEPQIDFDFREAVIYSSILERPEY